MDNLILEHQRRVVAVGSKLKHPYAEAFNNRLANLLPSVLLVQGDSTGNDSTEWVHKTGQNIAAKYLAYSVDYRVWTDVNQNYNAPIMLQVGRDGHGYAAFDKNVSFNQRLLTVSKAGINVTADIEIAAKIAPNIWNISSGVQSIISRFGGAGNRGWNLSLSTNRKLYFWWSSDGTANSLTNSDTLPVIDDGSPLWVKVTMDVDNGSGGYDLKFYTSTNGETWVQLGATTTGASTTSIYNPNTGISIGSREGADLFDGKIYRAIVKDGINGKVIASPDLGMAYPSTIPEFKDAEGNIWVKYNGVTFGLGSPTLLILNASTSGKKLEYSADVTRFGLQSPIEPHLSFINYGHNEGTSVEYTTPYENFCNQLLAAFPNIGIVCTAQNPQQLPETRILEHGIRCEQIINLAKSNGYGLIDVYNTFIQYGDFSVLMTDGVHPNAAGQSVWANLVKNWLGI